VALLEALNLTKYYRQGPSIVRALNGVSLRIEAGELVAVMGRSGSGKTTLLDVVGLLQPPTSGEVWLESVEVSKLSDWQRTEWRRRRIGFVFQEYNLLPGLTALENVLLPVRYDRSMDLGIALARARRLLGDVGLGARAGHRPRELSGGERQRVAIARALMMRPALVLADEPTAAVDSETGAVLLDLIHRLRTAEGTTFIVVTHDPEVAAAADRIIHIRDGRLWPRRRGARKTTLSEPRPGRIRQRVAPTRDDWTAA
jgi:ABC-type lipoprotein export system ATPase subunit